MIGERAVVIGAGIGGLSAAGALADHFGEVVVLERDELPARPDYRAGTPQCRHAHVLLTGGLEALEELAPGLRQSLLDAGAVRMRTGMDLRFEVPGLDPFPQRDLGWDFLAMSRPLTERTLRGLIGARANVDIRTGCRVEALVGDDAVRGVRFSAGEGAEQILDADLVVDACGPAPLLLAWLKAAGKPAPEETVIGVDIGYSTVVFEIPDGAPTDWKGVVTISMPPEKGRGCFVFSMEGNRWIATLTGRGDDRPPGDWEGWLAYAQTLRTPTLYQAIKDARRLTDPVQYRFPASIRRRFDRYQGFPKGVLPFGDALCRFNPIYGQGMSVAAQEGRLLRRLLDEGGEDLAQRFLDGAQEVIEAPWSTACSADLIFPETKGARPDDFERSLQFERAITGLAARDIEVQRLWQEVAHLLKPLSAYNEPGFRRRLAQAMANA